MKITTQQLREIIREEIQKMRVNEVGIFGLISKMNNKLENDLQIKKAWQNIKKDERFQSGYEKLSPSDKKRFEQLLNDALKTDTEGSANYVLLICKFIVNSNKFDSSLENECKKIIQLEK
mgnify:CR=1 FL=1